MSKHIGIVAVSSEGAALFYRQVFRQASKVSRDREPPVVSMHNRPLTEYIDAVRNDDWERVGSLLVRSAKTLAASGADFCLTPDNAVQHGVLVAEHDSPIPWITMTDSVAHAIERDGRKNVGIIGTRWVTQGSAYQTTLGLRGIKTTAPTEDQANSLDRIIFSELIYGEIRPESLREVLAIAQDMADRGAEAIILATSEAPLLLGEDNSPLPLYDTADLLAAAAIEEAFAPND